MSNWLIAIAATLLIGGLATFYFLAVQRRHDETRAGIAALSAVSWRSFIRMVLDALSRRGLTRLVDENNAGDDSDYVLSRDDERWLLSCKHGSAFVLGRLTINELARAIELKDATGGFLVTQGRISDEVRPMAALQRIELLDGPTLWPQLRDFLPAPQLAAIRQRASRLARQRVLSSWLFALLAGVAIWFVLPAPARPLTVPPAAVTASEQPPATAPAGATASGTQTALPEPHVPAPERGAAPPVAPQAQSATAPPSAGMSIERQRVEIAATVSTLPDVAHAFWPSESTLHVILGRIDGDAFARICPLIERYDELATSRIQLSPPAASGRSVRFRQCRLY